MAGARATKLLASPSDHMSDSELREALQLLEDVLIYRPHDPELNDRAGRVCLRLGKLDPAQEYAETCIERCPDVAAYHTLLGRIYREKGNLDAAMHEFETALKHDAEDLDAQRALASVRIGHRDAVRGGAA
jgi:predicted Zn-dependent protease